MKNLGYVEAKIDEFSIKTFHRLILKICHKNDFYKSDVIDYINGDVTNKLHLTLFYGCNVTGVKLKQLKNYVRNIKLSKLNLGRLFLIPGYKNLYQVLCVEVIDGNNELKNTSNNISNFGYDSSVVHDKFTPHLTLAYVNSNYKVPSDIQSPKSVKVKAINYFCE